MNSRERLRLTKRFLEIRRRGTWVRERALAVGALPNHLAVTRIGIRVKSGLAGAVGRNAAKRLFRETYRRNKARLASGWDVVAVLTQTAGLSGPRMESEFLSACTKLKLLISTPPTA